MKLSATTLIFFLLFIATFSEGAGPKVSEPGNKHNFSSTNTAVSYRAANSGDSRSSQICVFCHTPHRSNPDGPLWNRSFSTLKTFKHYSSTTLAIDDPAIKGVSGYGQPNGSSRLCLSCHDGVTALGAVFTTPGATTSVNIPFTYNGGAQDKDLHISYETYSSHHPVSFKYNETVRVLVNSAHGSSEYKMPSLNEVKLDSQDRMQCMTCHNPHQDQSDTPDATHPFWVYRNYPDVCKDCHSVEPLNPWKP